MSDIPNEEDRQLLGEQLAELIDARDCGSLTTFFTTTPSLINSIVRSTTALGMAVFVGDRQIVAYLLSRGANVEVAERVHEKPLFVACRLGRPDLVKILVDHGADVNTRTESGQTPMLDAAQACDVSGWPIAEILMQHGASLDLNSAVYFGRIEEVEKVLAVDSQAIAHAPFPNDLVYAAVVQNSIPMLRLLLEHGADVNGVACAGVPALYRATDESINIELMKILLDRGANVEVVENLIAEMSNDGEGTWVRPDRLALLLL